MRDIKERILSCLMAIVLCMTPPVMFLAQAEKEDITMRLEVKDGEERKAVFADSKEDSITAHAGSRQEIYGMNTHGAPVPVREVEMYTAEGEKIENKGEIREGKYHFKAPDTDTIIHVTLEESTEEDGKKRLESASGNVVYREIRNGSEGYGCFD